jgi:hypothetical protein
MGNRLGFTFWGAVYDYTISYDAMGRFEKFFRDRCDYFLTSSIITNAASNETQRYDLVNGVTQI